MSEESRKEILDLLARGKLSVDEAVVLLSEARKAEMDTDEVSTSASDDTSVADSPKSESPDPVYKAEKQPDDDETILVVDESEFEEPSKEAALKSKAVAETNGKKPSWLRVRVGNLSTGKNKVTVNIPYGIVKFGLNVASRFSPEVEEFDLNELSAAVNGMAVGMIVDVEDAESDERVQVYLE